VVSSIVAGVDLRSPAWIKKVATTRDSDLRAHRIALTYSTLGTYLDFLINGVDSVSASLAKSQSPKICNANWFHFATWGTLTVTQNIGTDRPPQRLNVGLGMSLRRRLTPAVVHARAADGQVVGRALAWGQRLIFVSACFGLRHFEAMLTAGVDADEIRILSPEDSTPLLVHEDVHEIMSLATWDGRPWIQRRRHLGAVERAFQLFAHAARADDRVSRARLILGANILLTAVEQDLVDPAISIVVNLVPSHLEHLAEWRAARFAERVYDIPTQISTLALPYRFAPQRAALATAWSRFMTDKVLVMALPTETLRLGRDVPPRHRGEPFYPDELGDSQLGGPTAFAAVGRERALQDVADLVASMDRTAGNGHGSAARDWRRWDERMNWAVTLMRSRQQDATLFWSPYTEEDQHRIVAGELPRRAGDPSALEVQAPLDGSVFWSGDMARPDP